MKCLSLILVLIALVSVFADTNVYKKDFDKTGKAYFFNPKNELENTKIAVGDDCTIVIVSLQDAQGNLVPPSETQPLSTYGGIYKAEKIRYPGGKCTLPDTQKYGKEVIKSTADDLFNYFNDKQGPLAKYTFKTEDKATASAASGFFRNKWVVIGIIGGVVLLGLVIGGVVFMAKRGNDEDDYSRRYSTNDKDMKEVSEPYIGLNNNDPNDKFSIGQPFNTNTNFSTPALGYNSNNWNSPVQNSPIVSSANPASSLLAAQEEPKRINSLTFDEQQNFSNMMKKQLDDKNTNKNSPSIKASPGFGSPNFNSPSFGPSVPEEYEKYKTYRIGRRFTPQRNDELVVEIGHMVKMIKSFEDGWTLCYNINTKKTGYIPKNKLTALDQPQKPQAIFHSDTNSTTSSAYSTKPLLHSNSGASNNTNSYGRNRAAVNNRNNSNASRSGGNRGSPRGGSSPRSPGPNKYYRKPSQTENYGAAYGAGGGYNRSQNRYD